MDLRRTTGPSKRRNASRHLRRAIQYGRAESFTNRRNKEAREARGVQMHLRASRARLLSTWRGGRPSRSRVCGRCRQDGVARPIPFRIQYS